MKRFISFISVAVLLCTGCAAQEAPVRRSATGFYFDTVVTISAYVQSDDVLNEALALCGEYERALSKTIEGSDVWNINHGGGQPVAVSRDALDILSIAIDTAEKSGGAFDVTVAPAVALWDFTGDAHAIPDEADIAEAVLKVDYRKIVIDGDTVRIPDGWEIDLGGVAKGYIADMIAEFLVDQGVTSALLNFGGNVVAIGCKPDSSDWTVGIQDPKQPTGASLLAVKVNDLSVVTSGIYERGFTVDGVRYHHILDPATGWPTQNELASSTIFAKRSGLADALSTATFVLGLERGMALIEDTPDVEALFITREGAVYATEGAADLIVPLS